MLIVGSSGENTTSNIDKEGRVMLPPQRVQEVTSMGEVSLNESHLKTKLQA